MIKSITNGFMKKSVRALAFASILAASSACASAATIWNLVNVTFSDGATATGSFTIDSTFDALTTWDITVSGSNLGADAHFTTANSNFFNITSTQVELAVTVPSFAEFTIVVPTSAMTNAGGTLDLDTSSSIDCSAAGPCGTLSTGQISTGAVPEPSSIALTAIGGCILGFVLHRRRRALAA